MRLTVNADCMASSSAPNPYGQPQGSASGPSAAPADQTNLYYQTSSDYNQIGGAGAGGPLPPPASRRHQQPLMSSPAGEGFSGIGGEKPLLLQSSNSLAGSYDSSYLGGMSSDSELTTSSAAARHHHRPYSSQSRVYHAHPVPRPTGTQQPTATGSSSSNSSSSRYLPAGVLSADSPVSPILMQQQQQQFRQQQQAGSGRQLPQRPFKQSMSIDQQHHFQRLASGHSPAHQRGLLSEPLVGSSSYQQHAYQHQHQHPQHQQHQQQQQQQQAQKLYSSSGVSSTSQLYGPTDQYSRQLEMELVEQKTGQMSLYGAGGELAELPPLGPARSASSSSGRQLSNMGNPGLMGSISLEQQQQRQHVDPFHQQQHRLMQQCSQDTYATGQQQQQLAAQQRAQQQHARSQMTASADWLPPLGSQLSSSGGLAGGLRQAGHFKQTMSIDHYPASRQQQQQPAPQSHYSPARRQTANHLSGSGPATGDQYNSPLGSYKGAQSPSQQQQQQQLIGHAYDSPTGPAPNQQHAALYYASSMEPRGQQQQAPAHFLADRQTTANELKHYEPQQALRPARPKLQHQPSSSSSNSNLSGSQKSAALEMGNMMASSIALQQEQQDSSKLPPGADLHWQKSSSSVSSSHHYNPQQQQSPQHYKPPVAPHHGHQSVHSKPEILRRGYTSAGVMPGVGSSSSHHHHHASNELLASRQGALSESGDLSVSQASGHSGHQLASKRSAMRAPSPALDATGPHHSAPLQHHSSSSASGHGAGYSRAEQPIGMRSESTTGLPNGSATSSTLTKKSNSATQLSMSGTKKRLGFRKKQVTSFSVHRSEEVAPLEARHLVKQGSSVSEGDSSMSGDSSSRSWSNSNFKQQTSEELASMSFIDGLGKGQMISRQGLASPYLGDIQLSLCDRRGNLEVEVIRARNLQAKTNKIQPLTYVKLYLVKNRKCLGKAKTTLSNKRTLNPLFQQQLTFHEDYHGCILQSIVWGNFGKMDKKNFMGIAQISIDDLELSDTVISWYKLFLPSSLQTLPSKSLRHTLLSNSTESFTNTNNS